MEKFSYALEFYKNNIFDIETDNDVSIMKKAVMDAQKIEQHFSNVPNINLLRENIIISFKFNKNIDYENRINYIRGIVYSKSFINLNDMFMFNEYIYSLTKENEVDCDEVDELLDQGNMTVSTEKIESAEINDENYINLYDKSPLEIVQYFKYNFIVFSKSILKIKKVPTDKENYERKYIIKGMKDWYTYMINIFNDLYDIYKYKLKMNSTDLSQFI